MFKQKGAVKDHHPIHPMSGCMRTMIMQSMLVTGEMGTAGDAQIVGSKLVFIKDHT